MGQDVLFCELPDHQFTLRNGFGGGMVAFEIARATGLARDGGRSSPAISTSR
jgi:hypothetical protein